MAVQLGKKYTDKISNWTGVATGRYDFLNGCQRITLAGSKDGEPEEFTFDVQQLVDMDGNPADMFLIEMADGMVEWNEKHQANPLPNQAPSRVGGPRTTPSRSGL